MKLFILLTLFFIVELNLGFGQLANDNNAQQPAVQIDLIDTSHFVSGIWFKNYPELSHQFLKRNKYINLSQQQPVFFNHNKRHVRGKEFSFYLISCIILLFGFFKVFYERYFNNIFRVFFNTSLRQNQLTDMLMQSKLPSLIF